MQLHPRHFGPHLRDKLVAKLMKDVEGTCRFLPLTPSLSFDTKDINQPYPDLYQAFVLEQRKAWVRRCHN